MTWKSKFTSNRKHDIDVILNQAKVALTAGNFDLANEYATKVLNTKRVSTISKLAAELLQIQTRSRQGLFSGLLDQLDLLFRRVARRNVTLQAKVGNEILWVCFRSGNLGIGASRGEAMLAEFASNWPEVELVELLCQLSSCHYHRGDDARAEEVVSRALKLAQDAKSAKGLAQSLWQSAASAELRGDLTLALEQVTEAKQWARAAGLENVFPALNHNTAVIILQLPNADLSLAHKLAESAYLEASSQNSAFSAAYPCVILSEIALRQEEFETALMYAKKGLSELPAEIPGPKTSLLVQVAKVLARMGNCEESTKELVRATDHMEHEEPSRELAKQWGDIARVYVEVGLTDRGVYAYEKAIQMSGLLREEQETEQIKVN